MTRRFIGAGALGVALAFQIGGANAQELKGEYRLGVLEPQIGRAHV